jgi:hypothetical protein
MKKLRTLKDSMIGAVRKRRSIEAPKMSIHTLAQKVAEKTESGYE